MSLAWEPAPERLQRGIRGNNQHMPGKLYRCVSDAGGEDMDSAIAIPDLILPSLFYGKALLALVKDSGTTDNSSNSTGVTCNVQTSFADPPVEGNGNPYQSIRFNSLAEAAMQTRLRTNTWDLDNPFWAHMVWDFAGNDPDNDSKFQIVGNVFEFTWGIGGLDGTAKLMELDLLLIPATGGHA